MLKINRFLLTLVFVFSAVFVYAADENKIIATVDNEVITEHDLKTYLAFTRMQLSERFKGEELENKLKSFENEALDNLIEDKLILTEAKKKGMIIKKEFIKEKTDNFRKNFPSESEMDSYLVRNGLTISDLENKFKEQIMTMEMIDLEVRSKVAISPGEITDYYLKNKDEFKEEEKREVLALLAKTKVELNRAQALLNTKVDFSQVQKELDSNINLGYIYQSSLKPEIAKIVFSLGLKEYSKPLLQADGYYIFFVNDIIKNKEKDLRDAQAGINQALLDNKMSEQLSKWLDKLKEKSKIVIRN